MILDFFSKNILGNILIGLFWCDVCFVLNLLFWLGGWNVLIGEFGLYVYFWGRD